MNLVLGHRHLCLEMSHRSQFRPEATARTMRIEIGNMHIMLPGRSTAIAFACACCCAQSVGALQGWSVWVHNETRPGQVAVAAPGALQTPWRTDGGVFPSLAQAWKRACWLTRQGDIYGRRYTSKDVENRRIVCDANCNCR